MKVLLALFFTIVFIFCSQAQIIRPKGDPIYQKDTTSFKKRRKIKLNGKVSYRDYKIISVNGNKKLIDSTLSIKKEYLFNYIRKDNFQLLQFHNQGQTFSVLGKNFRNQQLAPLFGASAKHYNYYTVNDIYYYHVPTPSSEAMYKTGLEQGQLLDFLVTMNTSPEFNFSLAYKGLRSLGKYRHALASHGNFRASAFFKSKNKRYDAKFHYYLYDLMNEENGGITKESKILFEKNEKNYRDRARLLVNYTDASSMLEGKRFFLQHSYSIFKPKEKKEKKKKKNTKKTDKIVATKSKDSLTTKKGKITKKKIEKKPSLFWQKYPSLNIKFGHTFMYESKKYSFNQSTANPIIGTEIDKSISDKATYNLLTNKLSVSTILPYKGEVEIYAKQLNHNYFFNSIAYINDQKIPHNLKYSAIEAGNKWEIWFNQLRLRTDVKKIIGKKFSNHLKGSVYYQKMGVYNIEAYIERINKAPNFNKTLYQSSYLKYNWHNAFKNENIRVVGTSFKSKWGALHFDYTTINNYTYFTENSTPKQFDNSVNIIKLKALNEFRFTRKFRLANTILFQHVSNGADVYRVPKFYTRNSLYYQSNVFKGDPLFIQVGVHFRYFTKYNMDAFDPVLNEFHLQNNQEIGDYPIFDFFMNGRVKHTRLFFKVENFAGWLTGFNYYAAPNHPYRDLTVRFGLVWNWFM